MILFGGVRQRDGKSWRLVRSPTQVALKVGTSGKPMKFVRRRSYDSDAYWEQRVADFIGKICEITQDW